MARTLAVTALLTALLGFAAGWLLFSHSDPPVRAIAALPAPSELRSVSPRVGTGTQVPDATGNVTVVQRFALQPADVAADRETPAVAVTADGTVVLAWASQTAASATARTLYLARSRDAGATFSTPLAWRSVPIYRFTSNRPGNEPKMAFSTHVLPRLVATRDGLALGWVEAITGGPTVQYLTARSQDGGATFTPPVAAAGGGASRPGFTTLAADPAGGLACGWLDEQKPCFTTWPADSEGFGTAGLVFAGPEGKGVCPCCDVAVAVTPDRVAVGAFRNSDAGHRDIWLARGAAGTAAASSGAPEFAAPVAVAQEPWTWNGCPHDGPSLALAGTDLHVAWMDGHSGTQRVYHAVTPVGDLRFHPRPLSPPGRAAQGHPRLAAGSDGTVHAVWDESLGDEPPAPAAGAHAHSHAAPRAGGAGRAIMYAVSRDGGASFSTPHMLVPSPGAYQTQPSLTVRADGLAYVAWNEIDQDGKHVVLARLARPAPTPEPPAP
jgi:hypothetical protein